MNKTRRNSLLLILAAFIWGTCFVAQSAGGDVIGPYSFNGIRMLIGGLFLLPVIALFTKTGHSPRAPKTREDRRTLTRGGILTGIFLFFASNLQQVGINLGSSVGKAAFLTDCYIFLVPMLGIFLGKKCPKRILACVAVALVGLYLLCITDSLTLQTSDILLILCAFVFAAQILSIDHYTSIVDGLRLACFEFFVCGILTLIPMFFYEILPAGGFLAWAGNIRGLTVWGSLLYAGIFSCGIAYSIQAIAQDEVNPTVASLIMSLESVFSTLFGWILLKEHLTGRELLGCFIIFIAVILAQLPGRNKTEEA